MQIVKGNFKSCYTNYLRKIGIIEKNETCIYNKEDNNDKLYARSYVFGEVMPPKDEFDIVRVPLLNTNDRELLGIKRNCITNMLIWDENSEHLNFKDVWVKYNK